jgi:hypothetical protein
MKGIADFQLKERALSERLEIVSEFPQQPTGKKL